MRTEPTPFGNVSGKRCGILGIRKPRINGASVRQQGRLFNLVAVLASGALRRPDGSYGLGHPLVGRLAQRTGYRTYRYGLGGSGYALARELTGAGRLNAMLPEYISIHDTGHPCGCVSVPCGGSSNHRLAPRSRLQTIPRAVASFLALSCKAGKAQAYRSVLFLAYAFPFKVRLADISIISNGLPRFWLLEGTKRQSQPRGASGFITLRLLKDFYRSSQFSFWSFLSGVKSAVLDRRLPEALSSKDGLEVDKSTDAKAINQAVVEELKALPRHTSNLPMLKQYIEDRISEIKESNERTK